MKKILSFALALPLLFACNKGGNEATLETPKLADKAAKVVAVTPVDITVGGKTLKLKEIDFLRSGRYVAEAEYIIAPGITTKATAKTAYLSGTFTFDNGKYNVVGDIQGSIVLNNNQMTINGKTTDVTVTPSNIPAGSTQDQISRSWKLEKIILDFEALGGRALYANVAAVVNDFEAHEVTIDPDVKTRILQHEIKEVTVDTGIVCVTFTQAEPFKGQFSLSSNNAFSYNFEGTDMNGDLFATAASGTIKIDGKKAVVSMNVQSGIKDLGNGTAEITLVAVD